MKPYFTTKERQEELLEVLESWVGTPHMHLVAVKGLGADCALFVWEAMKESGGVKSIKIDLPRKHGHIDYPQDRALHSTEEVLLKALRSVSGLREMPVTTRPMNGDICCYQFGNSTAHLAVFYEGKIYHALTTREVHHTTFSEKKYMTRLTAIFRVMEE